MSTPLRPEDPSASNRPLGVGRPMTILGAIAVGIGLVGFLVGIAEPEIPHRAVEPKKHSISNNNYYMCMFVMYHTYEKIMSISYGMFIIILILHSMQMTIGRHTCFN